MLNIDNILKTADLLDLVPQAKFDMLYYREDVNDNTTYYQGVQDALGHMANWYPEACTYLQEGDLKFWDLPESVLGITDDDAYFWCFDSKWTDWDNTPTGCADRLRFLAEYGEEVAKQAWKEKNKK